MLVDVLFTTSFPTGAARGAASLPRADEMAPSSHLAYNLVPLRCGILGQSLGAILQIHSTRQPPRALQPRRGRGARGPGRGAASVCEGLGSATLVSCSILFHDCSLRRSRIRPAAAPELLTRPGRLGAEHPRDTGPRVGSRPWRTLSMPLSICGRHCRQRAWSLEIVSDFSSHCLTGPFASISQRHADGRTE